MLKLKPTKHNLKTISFIALIIIAIAFLSVFLITQMGKKVSDNDDTYLNDLASADNLAINNKQENADIVVNNVPGEIPPISANDNYKGELNAPVEIIVYDDFTAPFSSDFAAVIEQAIIEHNEEIVVVYRYFPSVSDALSLLAAMAAECAGEQGSFWEMHDLLFEANANKELDAGNFNLYAEGLGLNTHEFNDCFENTKYRNKILKQADIAAAAMVTGTPTFFVNNNIYIGAYPYEDFIRSDESKEKGLKSIIEGALDKK